MLAWEQVVEAKALRTQGWLISAIARHLGVTRVTVRRYLSGEATPGERSRSVPDPFDQYAEYARLRLVGDPHLWATTLFDELVELGYGGSYPTFTRALRARDLRPVCLTCRQGRVVDRSVIPHPPGEETQWDWLELPDPPTSWGWTQTAYVLIGSLPHSGRWRGWLAEATDQAHLSEGLDAVTRRLGGVTRRWRFDRMATVAQPGTGRMQVSFGPVALHYAVGIDLCPAYHAWRKGSVEKGAQVIAQRWWRTLSDERTHAQAQASLDRLCPPRRAETQTRRGGHDGRGAGRGRAAAPGAGPVRRGGRGDPHGHQPGVDRLPRQPVLGATRPHRPARVDPSSPGYGHPRRGHRLRFTLARHRREPDGMGAIVRTDEHVAALEKVVLANFADQPPCRGKHRRPPSAAALAEADQIRRAGTSIAGEQVVLDFAAYAAATRPLHGHRPEAGGEQR
jgi:transposase